MKTTTSSPRQTTVRMTPAKRNQQYSRIKQLWLEGKTKSYIARSVKISFETVEDALIEMGIDKERVSKKLPTIDSVTGRIPIKVPGTKGTFYVRPENVDRFRERYNLTT